MEVKEPKRRGRKPKAELDAALNAEINEIALEILHERQIDSRRVAAIEKQNKLLEQILALHTIIGSSPSTQPFVAKQAAPLNPCCICGRSGIWKNPRGGAWHCKAHAAQVIASDKEEALGGSLLGALKQAKPA